MQPSFCKGTELVLRRYPNFPSHRSKVADWSESVISSTLKGLQSLNKPYKYVVTCLVQQKNGAGLVSAASTYWDVARDDLCKFSWENNTMQVIVTVFGACLNVERSE